MELTCYAGKWAARSSKSGYRVQYLRGTNADNINWLCSYKVTMKTFTKYLLMILILSSSVGCDQITKNVAKANLTPLESVAYLGGLFQFQYIENSGAMLGLGAKLPQETRVWTLIVFNGVMLMGMIWFIWRSKEMSYLGVLGSTLIIGGGISNIIDRLVNNGAVVDFMHIGIGPVRTGIFNVADVAIMAGVGLLLYWGLSYREAENKPGENMKGRW